MPPTERGSSCVRSHGPHGSVSAEPDTWQSGQVQQSIHENGHRADTVLGTQACRSKYKCP